VRTRKNSQPAQVAIAGNARRPAPARAPLQTEDGLRDGLNEPTRRMREDQPSSIPGSGMVLADPRPRQEVFRQEQAETLSGRITSGRTAQPTPDALDQDEADGPE
jgi:hypothetical protein